MQTKYRIDRDTRTLILKYIRKYDEYMTWYLSERERIINPSRQLRKTPGSPNIGDPTLTAAQRLEQVENSHRAHVVRAIDQARLNIGTDILDEKQSLAMRRAIWLSCLNGGEYNFEAFVGLVSCERAQFYRYKNQFLNDIKDLAGL